MKFFLLLFLFYLQLNSMECAKKYQISKALPDSHLYIIIDQTSLLTKEMVDQAKEKVIPFVQRGNAISVIKFSSNTKGFSTEVVYDVYIDRKLTEDEIYEISRNTVMQYDYCAKNTLKEVNNKLPALIQKITNDSSEQIPQSDILKNLRDISNKKIRNDKSKRKSVLIISDMIENSSIINFYKSINTPAFNMKQEVLKVKKLSMLADFGKADIYTIGTGYTTDGQFSSAKSIEKIKVFWETYFSLSNSNVIEMGQPLLLGNLK